MRKVFIAVAMILFVISPIAIARDVPNSEYPITEGNYGYLDGREIKEDSTRIAYIAGVHDSMLMIRQEILSMADGSNGAEKLGFPSEQWIKMSSEEKLSMILSALMVKLNNSVDRVPQGTTLGKLDEITEEYLTEHPGELDNDASLLVWKALLSADWK